MSSRGRTGEEDRTKPKPQKKKGKRSGRRKNLPDLKGSGPDRLV